MGKRYYIVHGDLTTHGGYVTGGSSRMSVNGIPFARLGDSGYCPSCKCAFTIVECIPNEDLDGEGLVVEGMMVSCGAFLIAGRQTLRYRSDLGDEKAYRRAAEKAPERTDIDKHNEGYDQHFHLTDEVTGKPLANRYYRMTFKGQVIEGKTDGKGCTSKVAADSHDEVKIKIFPEGYTGGTA